jgi:hypothetical protein
VHIARPPCLDGHHAGLAMRTYWSVVVSYVGRNNRSALSDMYLKDRTKESFNKTKFAWLSNIPAACLNWLSTCSEQNPNCGLRHQPS